MKQASKWKKRALNALIWLAILLVLFFAAQWLVHSVDLVALLKSIHGG